MNVTASSGSFWSVSKHLVVDPLERGLGKEDLAGMFAEHLL